MDAGVIVAVPLLVAVLLFQRRIVAGLTADGGEVGGHIALHQLESQARVTSVAGPTAFPGGLVDPRRIRG
jgi:hypothetical protein